MSNILKESIECKIREFMGTFRDIDVLDVVVWNDSRGLNLRVVADYPQGGITVDRCSQINRLICKFIGEEFKEVNCTVEVNSPGLDRDLVGFRDFLRCKNKEVEIWLKEPFKQDMYVKGTLIDIDKGNLKMKADGMVKKIPLQVVQKGRQVFCWK